MTQPPEEEAPRLKYSLWINSSSISLGSESVTDDIDRVQLARYLACQALQAAGADAHVHVLVWDEAGKHVISRMAVDVIGQGDPFVRRFGDPYEKIHGQHIRDLLARQLH